MLNFHTITHGQRTSSSEVGRKDSALMKSMDNHMGRFLRDVFTFQDKLICQSALPVHLVAMG